MPYTILLVEDEAALRMTIGDRLRNDGYAVEYAASGDQGLEKATRSPFNLIILDLMLPRRDGLLVCRDVRAAGLSTPILMLTARSRTEDKIRGLKIGADDYLTKPFDMGELTARVEALIRRTPSQPAASPGAYRFGSIAVDVSGTEVSRDGRALALSVREFQLLLYFVEHTGTTLSREALLTEVWGYDARMFTRTVDVHVASLRQKLEDDPKQPRHILTVPRLGYKFKE